MKVVLYSRKRSRFRNRRWYRGHDDVLARHEEKANLLHVIVCDDKGDPKWDQMLHFEPQGAVTIPVNSRGEIGLVEVERPVVRDDLQEPLGSFNFLEPNLRDLGVVSTEVPRGFPFSGKTAGETAWHKASAETANSPVRSVEFLGWCVPNTTYHPVRQPIFLAHIDEWFVGTIPEEVWGGVLKVRWTPFDVVLDMVGDGAIFCGFTTAAVLRYQIWLHRRGGVG